VPTTATNSTSQSTVFPLSAISPVGPVIALGNLVKTSGEVGTGSPDSCACRT
jgi:hypothetical protein